MNVESLQNPVESCKEVDETAEEARRLAVHALRVAHVNASHARGKRCLLARCFSDAWSGLDKPQPR